MGFRTDSHVKSSRAIPTPTFSIFVPEASDDSATPQHHASDTC